MTTSTIPLNESLLFSYLPSNLAHVTLDTCTTLLQSPKCCHDFLIDLNFTNADCLKQAVAKGLGYGIIVASTLVKLPQVLKIFSNKSGVGIAVFGVLLELLAITFNATYSYAKRFPFSAWGEAVFLLVETLLIAFLVLWYDGKWGRAIFLFAGESALVYVLTSGLTPLKILWTLQAMNLPLAVSGKLIQAYQNWTNQHTGQVSAITAWLLFLGCIVRVFTSIQETGDQLIVITYVVAASANFILVAQVHWYWNRTKVFLKKMQNDRKKKAN